MSGFSVMHRRVESARILPTLSGRAFRMRVSEENEEG